MNIEVDSTSVSCLACPGNREMAMARIRKHKKSASHRMHYKKWLADREAAARLNTFINNDQSHIRSDPATNEDQLDDDVHEDVELPPEITEFCRERLLKLWTKDHSMMFQSPVISVNSSQDAPIGNPIDRDDKSGSEEDNSDSSDDQRDCEEDKEPDDSWYPKKPRNN